MSEMNKILNRVRKMLNLANNEGATEGERDNALRMAHGLLAKHNLTMAMAEDSGQQEQEKRDKVGMVYNDYPWARHTAHSISKLFFCKYFYQNIGNGKCAHTYVGRESNAVSARDIAEYVIKSIIKESRKQFKDGSSQRSFCKGAADAIQQRCEELLSKSQQQKEVSSSGTAMVLADHYRNEMAANEKYLAAIGLTLRKKASQERGAGFGYHQGKAYGGTVSLNRQIV
jgi:hypothetical protein